MFALYIIRLFYRYVQAPTLRSICNRHLILRALSTQRLVMRIFLLGFSRSEFGKSQKTYLIEEDLSFTQNMLQFGQFQEVSFKRLCVLVHLTQFIFQFLKGCL